MLGECLCFITLDPNSGRPIAPIWWRLALPLVIYAWLMAPLLLFLGYEGARHGDWKLAGIAAAVGWMIVLLAHLEMGRIGRKRQKFDEQVAAYERSIPA